jgi:Fe-S-cluster-containing hydrogenase component 2
MAIQIHQLPVLDASLCSGCGDCVLTCPASCLEMSGSLPWLPRPLDCISCGLCAEICPTDALEMHEHEEVAEKW